MPQSDKDAAEYYRLAAAQGNADAQFHLGLCYEIGRGVPQSDAEALKYFRLAAKQGLSDAVFMLKRLGESV